MLRPRIQLLCALPFLVAAASAAVTFEEKPDRVTVKINGSLFTEYRYGDSTHVYYYPLIGPGGVKMTRDFPMEKVAGQSTDHPHHRSLWFSHGFVNGVDFWSEAATFGSKPPKKPIGKTEHVKVLAMESGEKAGVLRTSQKWIMPDGSEALTSVQSLRIHADSEAERILDFEVTLSAGSKDAVFGETKEGSAALRIADSMRLKQGKAPGDGHIVNSEGLKDAAVWGHHAKWVTVSGPIEGKPYAITVMDHPSNPRHPTRWHVRDYGLFAANPFCEYDMDKTQPKGSGEFTLKAGQSITLKYRILMTQGDENSVRQNDRYAEFAK